MKRAKGIKIYSFFMYFLVGITASILLMSNGYAYGASDEELLPEDPLMQDTFKPGFGSPVGKIIVVRGEAVIMHMDMKRGYRAERGLPLYKGDTLVTLSDARLRLQLNDESIITMVSRTRLTINNSIFDRAKKRFVSLLKMNLGKARFWVRKIRGMSHPDYRVKTPTAVVGIRGSDFVSEVTPDFTTITAFEDTMLEVTSVQYPEKPVEVKEYYRTMVKEGRLPTDPILVPLDEIQSLKKEFEIAGEEGEGVGVQTTGAEEILIPEELLVPPGALGPSGFEEVIGPDIERQEDLSNLEEDFQEQREDIEEAIAKGLVIPELPGFPGTP
jgi:hypothetical protein